MLTHAENITIHFSSHLFSKKGHVQLCMGNHIFDFTKFRLTREEFHVFISERNTSPFLFKADGKLYWLFKDKFYKDIDGLDQDAVKALLLSREHLKLNRINRAKTITASPKIQTRLQRGAIPDDVKLLVWQRDKGMCAKCGSQSELQYDHIIPVSVGGASTPENLQVLCGTCNRAKNASVS